MGCVLVVAGVGWSAMARIPITMKTITIRLPDVEAAMLVELQKVNRAYRDLQGLLVSQIQQEYAKTPKGRASR